jgi:hypothetical protein
MPITKNATEDSEVQFAAKIAHGDPVLHWLVRKRIPPILSGILYALGFMVIRGLVAWQAGNLWTNGETTGFLNDPAFYTNIVFLAIIWAYYTWFPKGIATVFEGLKENDIIDTLSCRQKSDEAGFENLDQFLESVYTQFQHKRWSIISLLVAAAAGLFLLLPQYLAMGKSASYTADPISIALAVLWAGVGLYCVLLMLIYSILSIYWLRKLFRCFNMKVRPLHPDGAGGLAPLGQYTLSLSYLIALVGILLVVTPITRNYVVMGVIQFRWTPELVIAMIAYLAAAPIVFFAPLSVAHAAMDDAKSELLLQIARRFDSEYDHIQSMLNENDISSMKKRLKNLKELQRLHKTTDDFPVWPFNSSNLTRFGTTYLSPIALAVFIDVVTNLIDL